jgi:hypothetical protein
MAAAGAVALDAQARADSTEPGLLGSGTRALAHARAVARVRELRSLRPRNAHPGGHGRRGTSRPGASRTPRPRGPVPLGYLLAAPAAGAWSDRDVLLVGAGLIVATTVLNLCVRDVYRVNRTTEKPTRQRASRVGPSAPAIRPVPPRAPAA